MQISLTKLEAEKEKRSFKAFGVANGSKLKNMDKLQTAVAEKISSNAL